MQYRTLGNTTLSVSQQCLGTMTWGTQNTSADAFDQIDCAMAAGVNFIDTAEMYPVTPMSADTQGDTETILGKWLKKSGKRDDVVIATKVTGKGPKWIDDGRAISGRKIRQSVEGSLQRLQTDYIDLYQLHWPNRKSYHFRQLWDYDPTKQTHEHMKQYVLDTLRTLDELIKEGKIRHIGLSNETTWGAAKFLSIAEKENLPRMVSVQNEYNLLCRLFDLDFAELSHNESLGLLAFSPLATGILTGKYENGNIPQGSRRSIQPELGGRYSPEAMDAATAYTQLANELELEPAVLALAFCQSRPFMTSTIIGATTLGQLKLNLSAADVVLSEDHLEKIAKLRRRFPMPM